MKLTIVLYLGTVLLVVAAAAPQKRNPIDFLLDYNQDLLINDTEVTASVKPITLSQVSSGGSWRNRQQDSEREELADVQEAPEDSKSDQSDEERGDSDEPNNSDGENQASSDSQKNQEHQSDSDEQHPKEDTTIRVYDDDDQEEDDNSKEEHNPKQHENPVNNSLSQSNETQEQHDISHDDRTEEDNSKYLDTPPTSSEENVPPAINFNPQHAIVHDSRLIEVQPDQLFNHGSLIFDKNSFVSQKPELSSTAPFNVKSWKGYHDTDSENWRHKFDFLDQENENEGNRFAGMPPPWNNWHHNHQHNGEHDHRGDRHNHDHDETGFHGHGFHRGGQWKWH